MSIGSTSLRSDNYVRVTSRGTNKVLIVREMPRPSAFHNISAKDREGKSMWDKLLDAS